MIFEQKQSENSIEYTVSMGKVNGIAFIILIPILVVYLAPYLMLWNFNDLKLGYKMFLKNILFILIGGIVLHELLHGVTWAIFSKKGFRQIKFGINWKYLTPYTHFKKPLKIKNYLFGALMPLLIMGIIPAIAGIATGNAFYLIFGVFFTWAAIGDIITSIRLFRLPWNSLVQDHPEKLGFIVFKEATKIENFTSI